MTKRPPLPMAVRLDANVIVFAFAVLTACRPDAALQPEAPRLSAVAGTAAANGASKLDVCHFSGAGGKVINVSVNAWPAHRNHGDYVLAWQVTPGGTTGDGIHFAMISDALEAATAARRAHLEKVAGACRITIAVDAGTYSGSFTDPSGTIERLPFFLGVPDITLRGAYAMHLDAQGRATGQSDAGETTLVPDQVLTDTAATIVVADDDAGYVGNGVAIEGFRFASGSGSATRLAGRMGIGALRVQGLSITGNQFDPKLVAAVDVRASSAEVVRNHASGIDGPCVFCLAGPGRYDVSANAIADGFFVGMFIAPIAVRANFPMGRNVAAIVVPAYAAPGTAVVIASVVNNDVRDQLRQPKKFGTGIRVVTFQKDAAMTSQLSDVALTGNTLAHNKFALVVDANTRVGGAPPTVPGNVVLTLSGNTIGPSCRQNVLVSFTRISHSIGIPPTTEAYLDNSTYRLTLGGDTPWSSVWYDNLGGSGNQLIVDGALIPPGKRTAPAITPGC